MRLSTMLKPDHELGFTATHLKANLTTAEYKAFTLWMRGQTMALVDGKVIFYATDVTRWISGLPVID